MARFSFTVNGAAKSVDSRDPAQPLLDVLRNALGARVRTVPITPQRIKEVLVRGQA